MVSAGGGCQLRSPYPSGRQHVAGYDSHVSAAPASPPTPTPQRPATPRPCKLRIDPSLGWDHRKLHILSILQFLFSILPFTSFSLIHFLITKFLLVSLPYPSLLSPIPFSSIPFLCPYHFSSSSSLSFP